VDSHDGNYDSRPFLDDDILAGNLVVLETLPVGLGRWRVHPQGLWNRFVTSKRMSKGRCFTVDDLTQILHVLDGVVSHLSVMLFQN
jgi:hypothetical protein